MTKVDFGEKGTFKTEIARGMAIHGITNAIKTISKISTNVYTVSATGDFMIKLENEGNNGQAIATW